MEASVVDMRYKTTEIISALDRNETVSIYYHGSLKGIISPISKSRKSEKITNHPFFGMDKSKHICVDEQIDILRSVRF